MIYGDSGLGKTHLLHALGHYVHDYYQNVTVKYVSTEELTNDFINAISENRTAAFRRTYRDVDVLLIDDIQFLEAKIQTQEEFFHTFNTLHNAQKQIVMTSDRPPKALEALEPRLRSRFEWGLITDVQPPDLETRIAILKRKAAAERLLIPPDVLEFIASRIQTNIRELEGPSPGRRRRQSARPGTCHACGDRIPVPARVLRHRRSEERRVGKECRSRWSPYH